MDVARKFLRSGFVFRRCGVIAFTAILSFSCRDAQGPTEAVPPQPRFSESYVNYSNILPITSTYYPQYTMTGLPYFADPTVVELTVSGQLLVDSHPQTQTMNYDGPVGPKGAWSSGQSTCHTNVTFIYVYSGSSYQWGPGACPVTPDTGKSYTDTILVRGDGRVERAIGFREYTNECYPAPRCHSYSGDQTFSVRVLPADLKVVASKQMVTLNDWVTFTATANPDSLGGVKVPIKLTSWQWIPAGGGIGLTGQCYPNTNPCSRQIKESGTMKVTAIVQGVEKSAEVTVNCLLSSPPDSALNSPEVRDAMMATLIQALGSGPTTRLELSGWVIRRTNGTHYTIRDPGAGNSDCYFNTGPLPTKADSTDVLEAHYHVHPHAAPDSAFGCLDEDGLPINKWVPVDPSANGGGSDADWGNTGDGYPRYIVSGHGEIIRLDGSSHLLTPEQRKANPNRWWWNSPTSSQCRWAKSPNRL